MGMTRRYQRRAIVDTTRPESFAVCDRCGRLWNLDELYWQLQYGATGLYNTRMLVCAPCRDVPQPQILNPILPPDPVPVMNARPETYYLDEVDFLSTEAGVPITTEDDIIIVPDQPSQNFSEDP